MVQYCFYRKKKKRRRIKEEDSDGSPINSDDSDVQVERHKLALYFCLFILKLMVSRIFLGHSFFTETKKD